MAGEEAARPLPDGPTLREWLSRQEPFDCAMNPSLLGMFAHAGCLGALQREGLLRDLCGLAGASAGAVCGSILAAGRTVLEPGPGKPALHEDMRSITTLGERRWQVLDLAPGAGVLRGDGLEEQLGQLMPPAFADLRLPFACTAWSAWSRRTEVLQRGPLPRAVRASCAVPVLFHPTSHARRRWLYDGGIQDPSGSVGLRVLPRQPDRSLHVVVNRRIVPGLDGNWRRLVPPSQFGAPRSEVATVRLNQPPRLLFGEKSFGAAGAAVLATAEAVLEALDRPMARGEEEGHWVLEVDVAWERRQSRL